MWYLSSFTLHTAVISTVQSLLGSVRHSQVTLHLFQTHLLSWELKYIYHNGIASIRVKSCVLLEFPFVKNCIVSKKLQSPAGYEIVFLKQRENIWSCVCCVPSLTSLPLHHHTRWDQAIWWQQQTVRSRTQPVKMLCPYKHCSSLYFLKTITCLSVGLLRMGQLFSVFFTTVHWWITTNCCFVLKSISALWYLLPL